MSKYRDEKYGADAKALEEFDADVAINTLEAELFRINANVDENQRAADSMQKTLNSLLERLNANKKEAKILEAAIKKLSH